MSESELYIYLGSAQRIYFFCHFIERENFDERISDQIYNAMIDDSRIIDPDENIIIYELNAVGHAPKIKSIKNETKNFKTSKSTKTTKTVKNSKSKAKSRGAKKYGSAEVELVETLRMTPTDDEIAFNTQHYYDGAKDDNGSYLTFIQHAER